MTSTARSLISTLVALALLSLGACTESSAQATAPKSQSSTAKPAAHASPGNAANSVQLEAELDRIEQGLAAKPTTPHTTSKLPATPATAEPTASATDVEDSTETPSATTATLEVSRLVVATAVTEREPVGAASEFTTSDTPRLFAFVELENPTRQETEVEVAWLDLATGEEHRAYDLKVKAHKRWRTWAHAVAPKKAGAWALLLKDQAGTELARTPFTMVD